MGRHKTLKDSDVRELHGEGLPNIVIAEIMGVWPQTITKRMKELGLERNETVRRDTKRYAVYNHRTSEFVTEGTVKEIARERNIEESSVRNYLYRFRHGKDCPWEFYEVEQ